MRAMMRALSDGEMVVMTADIPKISRVCGEGIVTLAQLSGRPIVPVAVVTSRRIDFDSWDKASIGLPFGRGAMVLGEPVMCRATRMRRASRPCASPWNGGSTRSMSGPMGSSARRIREPRCAAPSLRSLSRKALAHEPSLSRQNLRAATAVLEPAVVGLLYWRQRKGREDRTRLGERQGYPSRARPKGHLVWVHGASIGETLSLLSVVERLTQRGVAVLVTSGTKTSASLIARRLPPGAVHQFVPVDVPRYVRRFLDHWQPDLASWRNRRSGPTRSWRWISVTSRLCS